MTRFSALPNWAARLILAGMAAAVILGAVLQPVHVRSELTSTEVTDLRLYRAIAERVMHGENYYAAAADQQRLWNYPTAPAQVFREPTLAWVLAGLRTDLARRIAIFGLSIVTFFSLRAALARVGMNIWLRLFALPLIGTALGIAWFPASAYLHEIWASLLIALSLSSYQLGWRRSSIMLGVLACLFRELAFPYLLAMAAFGGYERKYRELAGWAAAAVCFLGLFALHLSITAGLHHPGDKISPGWFYFGGWPFVLETAKRNVVLIFLANSAVAAVVCIAMAGLAGFRNAWIARIAVVVAGYMAAFLFVGRPENSYWGVLFSPLLPIGVALSPLCLRDLIARAWSPLPVPRILRTRDRRMLREAADADAI